VVVSSRGRTVKENGERGCWEVYDSMIVDEWIGCGVWGFGVSWVDRDGERVRKRGGGLIALQRAFWVGFCILYFVFLFVGRGLRGRVWYGKV